MNGHPPTPARRRLASHIGDARILGLSERRERSLVDCSGDENALAAHLYDPELPDPDLLIRTSGELRVSNFLLWQLAYSELIFVETLWPDFGREQLLEALLAYAGRRRRFGGR